MKKFFKVLLCLFMTMQLAACGSSSGNSTTSGSSTTTVDKNNPQNSDTIKTDEAWAKYIGFEKVKPGLILGADESNTYIFKFEYVNESATPTEVHEYFTIDFYQNGLELQTQFPFSSKGDKQQFELLDNYFTEVIDGGKITVAISVLVKDDSPVTVYMKPNGKTNANPVSYKVELK